MIYPYLPCQLLERSSAPPMIHFRLVTDVPRPGAKALCGYEFPISIIGTSKTENIYAFTDHPLEQIDCVVCTQIAIRLGFLERP